MIDEQFQADVQKAMSQVHASKQKILRDAAVARRESRALSGQLELFLDDITSATGLGRDSPEFLAVFRLMIGKRLGKLRAAGDSPQAMDQWDRGAPDDF